MSNISLKLLLRRSQNFHFLRQKEFVTRSIFEEPQLAQILFNFKTSYFNFERNYDVLKSKSQCILLNKNINFNENETESKMKNPTHGF